MYEIIFYEDRNGNSPVLNYMRELNHKTDPKSKSQLKRIKYQIRRLEMFGTFNGEPVVKHVEDKIWELRPGRDRVLFAAWIENSFVLLHCFVKDTQKTPRSEIEKAKRELKDFLERYDKDGRIRLLEGR